MNTPSESYEWFDMSISREDEFKLLRDRINIIEHAPRGQSQLTAAPRPAAEGYRAGKDYTCFSLEQLPVLPVLPASILALFPGLNLLIPLARCTWRQVPFRDPWTKQRAK